MDRPETLQEELKIKVLAYAKGFGNTLAALRGFLEVYAEGEKTEHVSSFIRDLLATIMQMHPDDAFYKNHPDCDLLMPIHQHVLALRKEAVNILEGKTSIEELFQITAEIFRLGMAFGARVKDVLLELRQEPGFENFSFTTSDMNGNVWTVEKMFRL